MGILKFILPLFLPLSCCGQAEAMFDALMGYTPAPSGGGAAVPIIVATNVVKATDSFGATNSFDGGSGSARYLIVSIAYWPAAYTPTISWNGVSLTAITNITWESGAAEQGFWGLLNPATGSNSLKIAFGSSHDWGAVSYFCTGVSQSTPVGVASAQTAGSLSNPTNVITTVATDLVIDCLAALNNSQTYTPTSPQNLGGNAISGGNNEGCCSSYRSSAGSSTTNAWTISAATTCALIGIGLHSQ